MNIIIRPASLQDLPAIEALAISSVPYGYPGNRHIEHAGIEHIVHEVMSELIQRQDLCHDVEFIVACEREKQSIIGYLIELLEHYDTLTGERQAFIQDMAIDKRYWGKFIPGRLMARAVERAQEEGLKYLVGVISKDNRRALGTATKGLGFSIERCQVVKKLL